MNPLITPSDADRLIQSGLKVMDMERVPASEAVGRVLAEGLLADRPLPPFNRVMMDGIAFRAQDAHLAQGQLAIAGLHAAGNPMPPPLATGACWEIMTGSALPPDCDTVVPVEEIMTDHARVSFPLESISPGKFIHAEGSDFSEGEELVPANTILGSREVAVAATVGATSLTVYRVPKIAIITTGDELVPVRETPQPHQVRQSNGPSLIAALSKLGLKELTHVHLVDEESAIRETLGKLAEHHDLLLVCGGISRGKRDFVRPALESLFGAPAFHGVSQRPGKPLAFWQSDPPVFALPGNPMSVLICFHRYVVPAFARLTGRTEERLHYPLASAVDFPPPLTYFLPVSISPDLKAHPRPLANSGDFASSIDSTGFIELPNSQDIFSAGFSAPYTTWL